MVQDSRSSLLSSLGCRMLKAWFVGAKKVSSPCWLSSSVNPAVWMAPTRRLTGRRYKRDGEKEVRGETEEEQHAKENVGVSRWKSSSRGQWYGCSPEAVVSLQHIHDGATGRSQHLVYGEERRVTTLPIMGCYA